MDLKSRFLSPFDKIIYSGNTGLTFQHGSQSRAWKKLPLSHHID